MPRRKTAQPLTHFAVPSTVDFDSLEQGHPPEIKSYKRDVAALFIDYIFTRILNVKKRTSQGSVRLKLAYLRQNLHRDATAYLKWLQACGVLETTPYIKRKQATGYALALPHADAEVTFHACNDHVTSRTFRKLGERIEKGRAREQSGMSSKLRALGRAYLASQQLRRESDEVPIGDGTARSHEHAGHGPVAGSSCLIGSYSDSTFLDVTNSSGAVQPLNDVQFCTGTEPAIEVIQRLRHDLTAVTIDPSWRRLADDQLAAERWSPTQYNTAVVSAQRIADGIFFCTRSPTNHRVNTSVTNLSKALRRFLRLDGCDDLTMIDVRSSQPYLLIGLGRWALADGLSMGLTTDALAEWEQLVTEHDIYEAIGRVSVGDAGSGTVRDRGKATLMQVLFSHNKQKTEAKTAFQARFPEIDAFVRWIKRYPHNTCAVMLQQLEALAVIDHAALRLMRAGVRVLTIHDSVVVPTAYATDAESILREELTAIVGVAPGLHVEALRK